MDILLFVVAFLFFIMLLFADKIIDFVFYIINKIDDMLHPVEHATRIWETKNIVNNMWLDENLYNFFIEEEVDKCKEKIEEMNKGIQNLADETDNYKKEVNICEKELIGQPTGHFFDLGFHQMNQDNCIKYKSKLDIANADIQLTIIELKVQLSKIGLYYELLKHLKEECKTTDFIESIKIAMENDISFVENNKKINSMDEIGFSFVETLLNYLNNEELNIKFKERLHALK